MIKYKDSIYVEQLYNYLDNVLPKYIHLDINIEHVNGLIYITILAQKIERPTGLMSCKFSYLLMELKSCNSATELSRFYTRILLDIRTDFNV